ncbi:hypothetical protein phiK7A1_046c [Pseudomonas phage phiK7A1]|uniref:Uncharacterized protein n=1 Tax=Pseudomonas phage phiK7A1 TaxID=2759194 RepID=A0A7H0XFP6_9CAUD|nr:hypothetical protein phiK7A1_046c [Pseudomonas phage phiK7A1]
MKREVLCTIIGEAEPEFIGKLKVTVVPFSQFSEYDFIPPATFFIQNAMGEYVFIHTSKRQGAQDWVDENYGKGRYTVKASKLQATKSKLESGGLSCTGTATRKGQKK